MAFRSITHWLCLAAILSTIARAEEPQTGTYTATFDTRVPMSSVESLYRAFAYRAGRDEKLANYNIADEKFSVFVPTDYDAKKKYGLLVWMGGSGSPPSAVESTFGELKLIWVSPNAGGRNVWHQIGLAVDAVANLAKRYNIDKRRIFTGGAGGGGQAAIRMGFGLPDVFNGVLALDTAAFCDRVQVPDQASFYWVPDFDRPAGASLGKARKNVRFIFTLEPWLAKNDHTYSIVHYGFIKQRYNAEVVEVVGASNFPTDPELLKKLVALLDGK